MFYNVDNNLRTMYTKTELNKRDIWNIYIRIVNKCSSLVQTKLGVYHYCMRFKLIEIKSLLETIDTFEVENISYGKYIK